MKKYQLITKFGVTDGCYDYHQMMQSDDVDVLKALASITQVIPYCKDDKLFITERHWSEKLNCYIGGKICY